MRRRSAGIAPRRSAAARRLAALALWLALGGCVPRTDLPGPPAAPPTLTESTYVAADGAALPVQSWVPNPSAPEAIILALHGMNDYANAFAEPGAWWAQQGIATFAYDQRGFGRSPHPGLWPGEAALVEDLDGMVGLLRARYPGTPLYLLGESMGGAVVIAALSRRDHPPVDGAILAAPAVWGRASMDLGKRVTLWLSAHTLPWWTFTGRGLEITPSDNREMLIALARDPLVIKETRVDAIWGLVNLMDGALADAPRLDGVPLLILYGERDEIIPKEPFFRMIGTLPPEHQDKRRLAIYPDGYHMLLRDLEAPMLWRDVLHWIENPAAALPSGADGEGL